MTLRFDALNFGDALLLEEAGWARGRSQKELTLSELIAGRGQGSRGITDAEIGTEIHSRIARAATIPLIPFLVLPLAFATKRGRRGLGILLGGILLAAFHHGINFARQPAAAGTVSPEAAIWGVAAGAAALTLIVFWTGRHLPSRSPIAGALAPAGRMLARARPQEAGRLRAMRGLTLATYLGWRLVKWALMAAFAIVLLLQLVDLVEQGDAFAARHMGAIDILYYAWLRLPPMLHQAIPIAALAAAMGVFAGLGRAQEMVAIRAAGLSQYRLLAMALPVPLLLAGASWLLAERAAPASEARLAAWWAARDPQPARAEHWFRIGAEIVRAETASPDGARLGGVTIFRRDARGLLTEQVRAAAAIEGEGGWRLTGVERHRFAANRVLRSAAAEDKWATPMRAADVMVLFSRAATLSSDRAQRSLDASAPASGSATLFATRLHRAWAEPLAPLVMLLLALPLAFAGHRRVAWLPWLYAGVGGLLYLTLDGVFTVAGQVGALPPPVGAWLAPVLFVLGGLTVLLYAER
jgi:lipopolysaccharide export system permease protein